MNVNETMARVRVVNPSATSPAPQTQVAIAIDTAYITANASGPVGAGVYMIDNQANMDSSGEGTLELTTVCAVGSLIGLTVYPIDTNSGAKVSITGFNISQGDVFGNAGYPLQVTPNYWIGQATPAARRTRSR